MKRFRRVTLILVTIAIGYVIWIVWPHLAKVAVRNEAGVSESDVSEIVEHLERERSFYGRGELATVLSCLFSPSSRPRYFVEIVGDDRKVVITAGYVRGLQWGAAPSSTRPRSMGVGYLRKRRFCGGAELATIRRRTSYRIRRRQRRSMNRSLRVWPKLPIRSARNTTSDEQDYWSTSHHSERDIVPRTNSAGRGANGV